MPRLRRDTDARQGDAATSQAGGRGSGGGDRGGGRQLEVHRFDRRVEAGHFARPAPREADPAAEKERRGDRLLSRLQPWLRSWTAPLYDSRSFELLPSGASAAPLGTQWEFDTNI